MRQFFKAFLLASFFLVSFSNIFSAITRTNVQTVINAIKSRSPQDLAKLQRMRTLTAAPAIQAQFRHLIDSYLANVNDKWALEGILKAFNDPHGRFAAIRGLYGTNVDVGDVLSAYAYPLASGGTYAHPQRGTYVRPTRRLGAPAGGVPEEGLAGMFEPPPHVAPPVPPGAFPAAPAPQPDRLKDIINGLRRLTESFEIRGEDADSLLGELRAISDAWNLIMNEFWPRNWHTPWPDHGYGDFKLEDKSVRNSYLGQLKRAVGQIVDRFKDQAGIDVNRTVGVTPGSEGVTLDDLRKELDSLREERGHLGSGEPIRKMYHEDIAEILRDMWIVADTIKNNPVQPTPAVSPPPQQAPQPAVAPPVFVPPQPGSPAAGPAMAPTPPGSPVHTPPPPASPGAGPPAMGAGGFGAGLGVDVLPES